jgi:hypothetical protein
VANIAITGPYGSGKSSVIRTFEKKYKDIPGFEFLNITLGSFIESVDSNSQKESSITYKTPEEVNASIEKSLLQQIIYKVEGNSLPDSQIRRIHLTKKFTSLTQGTFLLFWATSVFLSFKPTHHLFSNTWPFDSLNLVLVKVYAFAATIVLVQHALNLLRKSSLSKIGFATTEISFNERKGDSVLNKYLDEIIYFFSATQYNVVIIEDLDRFDEVEPFIKLRELNTLLNNSDQIEESRKPIKFIYSIRDDVFEDVLRTKFFDFIIPIIPIINSSNSAEMLIHELKQAFPTHSISPIFIKNVTRLIDDMRLLRNVVNEFFIYRNKLKGVELKDEKLLSLVVYKNLFPKDFVELNSQGGYIPKLVSIKEEIKEHVISQIEAEIDKFKAEMDQLEDIYQESLQELRAIYILKIYQQIPERAILCIGEAKQTFDTALSDENFGLLANTSERIRYFDTNNNLRVSSISFSDIETAVSERLSYKSREKAMKDKLAKKGAALQRTIDELNSKRRLIRSYRMKDVVENYSTQIDWLRNDVTERQLKLVKYLVGAGYIDEDYESYISFFYEGELSRVDKQFLISVASHEPLSFEYKLSNTDEIIQNLSQEQYLTKAILNFSLFEYLLGTSVSSKILENAFQAIVIDKVVGKKFVEEYLPRCSYVPEFIDFITKIWTTCWQELIIENRESTAESRFILRVLLQNASENLLSTINQKKIFSKYLSDTPEVFEVLEQLDTEQFAFIAYQLDLEFSDLSSLNKKSLLDTVHEISAYKINVRNIAKLLTDGVEPEPQKQISFTRILKSSREELKKYINLNIDEFVKNVLVSQPNTTESEDAALVLLNHPNLSSDLKSEVISTRRFQLSDVDLLNNPELWEKIFLNARCNATWNNVQSRFIQEENELSDDLIYFMNIPEIYQQLSEEKLSLGRFAEDISLKLIHCDSLSDEAYDRLIQAIPYWYTNLSELEISKRKLNSTLIKGKFQLTQENIDFLKQHLNVQAVSFLVEKNIDEFLNANPPLSIDSNCYTYLLQSSKIPTKKKSDIISFIKPEDLKGNIKLAQSLSAFILTKFKARLTVDILQSLLSQSIDDRSKLSILLRHAEYLTEKDVVGIVKSMGSPIRGLAHGKQPSLIKNELHSSFAEFLSHLGLAKMHEKKGNASLIKLYPTKKLMRLAVSI